MADTIRKTLIEYADNRAELYKYEADGMSTKANLEHALAEIKRIIEESMPIAFSSAAMIDSETNHYGAGYNHALEKYHTDLMKALGESIDK